MEIRAEGSKKSTFILNDEEVMQVFNMEQKDKDGKYVPLSKGRIGIQAEWAEILYCNILIKEMVKKED